MTRNHERGGDVADFVVRFYALDTLQALCILLRCALEKTIHRWRRVYFPEQCCRRIGVLKCCAGMVMVRSGFCISGVWGGESGRWGPAKSIFRFDSTM